MTYQEAIELCKKFEIYKPTKEPELIENAHKHKIYKVTTPGNKYAFKEFNLPTKNLEDQIELINKGQAIASKFQEFDIDAICGISEHGTYLKENEGRYYLIYPWTDGFVVDDDHIATPDQAVQIGTLLGKLHKSKIKIKGVKKLDFKPIDISKWDQLKSRFKDHEVLNNFVEVIATHLDKINSSFANSLQSQVISHTNLNKSNLIWQDNYSPSSIGWDWSGYTNPELELLKVAIDWASDGVNFEQKIFETIVDSYKKIRKIKIDNPEELIYASIFDTINWIDQKFDLMVETEKELAEIEKVMISTINKIEKVDFYNDLVVTITK